MSHSQFHCTGRVYLDLHGLIFETSICYWQDQPGSTHRAVSGLAIGGVGVGSPPPAGYRVLWTAFTQRGLGWWLPLRWVALHNVSAVLGWCWPPDVWVSGIRETMRSPDGLRRPPGARPLLPTLRPEEGGTRRGGSGGGSGGRTAWVRERAGGRRRCLAADRFHFCGWGWRTGTRRSKEPSTRA